MSFVLPRAGVTPLAGATAVKLTNGSSVKVVNTLSPVREFDSRGNEIFYRTMSETRFRNLERTGVMPPTTETSISPVFSYASKYDGVTVKFTTAPGISLQLQAIGIAANKPASIQFPNMTTQNGSWMQTNVRFKVEGGQMTTQLGQGKGIDIIKFVKVR